MKKTKILFTCCLLINSLYASDVTQFLSYSQNQISNNIVSNVDGLLNLDNYSKSIQNELGKSLSSSLDTNNLSVEGFKNQLQNAFADGFKNEAIKEINNLQLLNNSQKTELINGISNIDSLTGLKNYLSIENFNTKQLDSLVNKAMSLEQAQKRTLNTFDCACAMPLTNAFKSIEQHIIDNNLVPLDSNLKVLIETIKNNTEVAKEQIPVIEKSNKFYAAKIVEAQEHLHKLNLLLRIE